MTPRKVRTELIRALMLDLVGPSDSLGNANEVLSQPPSRWYLTGFLVPRDAPPEQAVLADSDEEMEAAGEGGLDDDQTPERSAGAKKQRLPSSMGLSFLVPKNTKALTCEVIWGDYKLLQGEAESENQQWARKSRRETVAIPPASKEHKVPNSDGLRLAVTVQPADDLLTVSVFLVNYRQPGLDAKPDEAYAFQAELGITSESPFAKRVDARGLLSDDWDERLADLQYADTGEYAVGHNVSAVAVSHEGECRAVGTCWIPEAQVERVAPASDIPAELGMEALAQLADGTDAKAKLMGMVKAYRDWIAAQPVPATPPKRKETAEELIRMARVAADRIEAGILTLDDPTYLEAFRIANRAMARAARRRIGTMRNVPEDAAPTPKWRPFQLAFLLMNLPGIAQPGGDARKIVDLLFFPTGGGKTEAYLGLAAFTLVLRRLRGHDKVHGGAGVSVLMRYTLRLLTLDQLGRAATLICALELEREKNKALGDWPFEIGLWVGRAATPNEMGSKERDHPDTARRRVREYLNDDRKPSPIPLEDCPWCGKKFTRGSFRLTANGKVNMDYPTDLQIGCVNRDCAFSQGRALPIVAVDEPIYRRLPCFIIATVDKFAGMPWTGHTGALFGRVDRYDNAGFYGACDPGLGAPLPDGRLQPPDLIIQDELHLISGPLGTMVGLYETALEELSCLDGVRPKIVASTATVRKADAQIRALFNRTSVDIFPPPGPNRRDSFFARTLTPDPDNEDTNARLYLGVAAQGRSPKVAMLRVYLALLGAGQKWYEKLRGRKFGGTFGQTAADPYMTLLGYFNALRELGGARRLIEDEVLNRLLDYGSRKRVGEVESTFADRKIDDEPVELTSRENTAKVSQAKQRLSTVFPEKGKVDVAIATNMISVGLDITRLGLMVIFGQPKTSAEYIQASSRVGRNPSAPGLVVTILNVHRPRDRSHYERFVHYHETFYRSVEATSVTPFSPRALDRGLAASVVALARLEDSDMTPPRGAMEILQQRHALTTVSDRFAERAYNHNPNLPATERQRARDRVRERVEDLLDDWTGVVQEQGKTGDSLHYNPYERGAGKALLQDFLDPELKLLPSAHWRNKFRANRSLRDVEPTSSLWVRKLETPYQNEEE